MKNTYLKVLTTRAIIPLSIYWYLVSLEKNTAVNILLGTWFFCMVLVGIHDYINYKKHKR